MKYTAENLTPLTCVCCGKGIDLLYSAGTPHYSNWNSGNTAELISSYGSTHDGGVFLISICDDCLTTKTKNGTIIYLHDIFEKSDTEKNRNVYNQQLHRKLKLKEILNK